MVGVQNHFLLGGLNLKLFALEVTLPGQTTAFNANSLHHSHKIAEGNNCILHHVWIMKISQISPPTKVTSKDMIQVFSRWGEMLVLAWAYLY